MANERKRIALIYGGVGRERDISLRSKDGFLSLGIPEGYEVLAVGIDKDGDWYLEKNGGTRATFPVRLAGVSGFLLDGEILGVELAIPLLHGDFGEDGRIQGALETAGIRTLGADTVSGAVCSDKGYTKAVAKSLGIDVARGVRLGAGASLDEMRRAAEEIGYPVFVKPTSLGSSIGASEVRGERDLLPAFNAAGGEPLLVEELIEDKRELEVGVLVHGRDICVSPPGEILHSGFYDYEKKYLSDTKTVCPARVSEEISSELYRISRLLAATLSLRGPSRIDFFLTRERLIFNEINTMPGFTRDSLYPRLMAAAGIPQDRLVHRMILSSYD